VTPFQEENQMQTRYRAAATALLLTATAGMAATGGAAEASGTHHAGKAAKSLTVTIKSKSDSVKLSDDTIRPGKTIFKVKNVDGKASKGLVQVFRLKNGYTLTDALGDFGLAFPQNGPPDLDAVHRIDANVVFYGGMEAKGDGSKVSKWAVNIDKASTYYVANLDSQQLTPMNVSGSHQKRAWPSASGKVDAESTKSGGNKFVVSKHIATSGWMSTTNKAEEPHFVDMEQVKKGTKNGDLTKMFNGAGPDVFVHGGATTDTGVISPGHAFRWAYSLKKAPFAVLCFWPSAADGMPHALMGMHAIAHVG
jgi:hypothetical protein